MVQAAFAADLLEQTGQPRATFLVSENFGQPLPPGVAGYTQQVAGDNQMSWRTQRTDGGTVFPSGGGPRDSANAGNMVPAVTLAVEHYNRMLRILDKSIPVKVELDIKAQFHDETDANGFNVFADLPGSE